MIGEAIFRRAICTATVPVLVLAVSLTFVVPSNAATKDKAATKERSFVARFEKTLPSGKAGMFKIGNIQWVCANSVCSGMASEDATVHNCADLVARVGVLVKSYKTDRHELSAQEVKSCNMGAAMTNMPPLKTSKTSAQPARDTGELKPSGQFVAKHSGILTSVQPAGDPGEPGPSGEFVDLVDSLLSSNPDIERDLAIASGWDYKVWQDGEDKDLYYYLPREYRIAINESTGLPLIRFMYGYEPEEHGDKNILMRADLKAPSVTGDVNFMQELLRASAPSRKNAQLKAFPLRSAEIRFDGAAVLISPDDVWVSETQDDVRDILTIQMRMDGQTKAGLVMALREGGVEGFLDLNQDEGIASAGNVRIVLSLVSFAEMPVSTLQATRDSGRLVNSSLFPVRITKAVAYNKPTNGSMRRVELPFQKSIVLEPGKGTRFPDPGSSLGSNIIHGWFDYTVDTTCDSCMLELERKVDAQPSLTEEERLEIIVPPFVFSDRQLFNMVVEISSRYFDASGDVVQTQAFLLMPGEGTKATTLFLDRDAARDAPKYEYRLQVVNEAGDKSSWTEWKWSGDRYLTISTSDIPAMD